MELQRKSVKLHVKDIGENGEVTAYVSIYGNADSYNERVVYGAFARSLEKRLPKGIAHHNWEKSIAKTLEATEVQAGSNELPDAIKEFGGLRIRAKFNLELTPAGTPANPDAYRTWSDMKAGILDEFSIGFVPIQTKVVSDGVLELTEIDLYEWSVVLVGANDKTLIQQMKSKAFSKQSEALGTMFQDYAERVRSIIEMRVKAGRTFSQSNYEALKAVAETVLNAGKEINALLEKATPESSKQNDLALAKIKILQMKAKGIIQ